MGHRRLDAAFPVVATIGVVALTGAKLPGRFWASFQAGVTVGIGFVHWQRLRPSTASTRSTRTAWPYGPP